MQTAKTLSHQELRHILPHAYPFLLIDRVDDYKENEYLIAAKNTTVNEWPFIGIGQRTSYYPETLLIEAAAQAALVLYQVSRAVVPGQKNLYILGKIKSEFSEPVKFSSVVKLHATAGKMLESGGYSSVDVSTENMKHGSIEIFYSVQKR